VGPASTAVVLNGWAMLGGGLLLLAVALAGEDVGAAAWTAQALEAIAYLAVLGSAVSFVVLTLLLRELPAVTMSFIALLLPLGALAFGAALYDEPITALALGGAGLVWAGIAVAQWPARRPAPVPAR
jgi:drug/metabolite transporter (DMT)-like permease